MFLLLFVVHIGIYWTTVSVYHLVKPCAYNHRHQEAVQRTLSLHLLVHLPLSLVCEMMDSNAGLRTVDGVWQFPTAIFLVDLFFYHAHRLLHHFAWLYSHIHSRHHQWTNDINILSTFDTHPLEHVMVNLIPVLLAIIITNMNILVAVLFVAMATVNSMISHSRHPLMIGPHDKHHEKRIVNFGVGFMIFDKIYNTYE